MPTTSTDPTARARPLELRQYDRVAIVLHWLLAALIIGEWIFGHLLDDLGPSGTPERATVINLHKSIGLTIGLLVVLRIVWRFTHRAPPMPEGTSALMRRLAHGGHHLLYLAIVVVPLSGYLMSNFGKYGIDFFGLFTLPAWGPDDKTWRGVFHEVHEIGTWVLALLVVGHVAAALYHTVVLRDGTLSRMSWRRNLETRR